MTTPTHIQEMMDKGTLADYLNRVALVTKDTVCKKIRKGHTKLRTNPQPPITAIVIEIEKESRYSNKRRKNILCFAVETPNPFVEDEIYVPQTFPETLIETWATVQGAAKCLGVSLGVASKNFSKGQPPFWSPKRQAYVDLRDIEIWNTWVARKKLSPR